MTANTNPIFSLKPNVSADNSTAMPATITTATGDYTGASANHVLVHTAGANGSYVRALRFKAIGTNVTTVARIYINNGFTNATAANNVFIEEVQLPATTASNTAPTVTVSVPLELAIDPSFRIYVGVATTVAAGWVCSAIAGQY
jgi:hypothetical protein